MKLRFKATGTGPTSHSISGETVNGLDLSPLQHGDKFTGSEATQQAGIKDAYLDESGELWVTLKQCTISSKIPGLPAHWRGKDEWIDAKDYDPEVCYVEPTGLTKLDNPPPYTITIGTDCAGQEGWTVKRLEPDGPEEDGNESEGGQDND